MKELNQEVGDQLYPENISLVGPVEGAQRETLNVLLLEAGSLLKGELEKSLRAS